MDIKDLQRHRDELGKTDPLWAILAWHKKDDPVDIAPSMIKLAEEHNDYKGRCRYVLNEKDDLTVFPDNNFDFIYSSIVLQHMEPQYAIAYLKEFMRTLRSNGLLIFQIPSRPNYRKPRRVIKALTPKFIFRAY